MSRFEQAEDTLNERSSPGSFAQMHKFDKTLDSVFKFSFCCVLFLSSIFDLIYDVAMER